jgi:hypothetical protein
MLREKSEGAALRRKRVPMRGTGAEQSVVVMKRPKGRGAKGLRHPVGLICQPARGGAYEFGKSFYHTKGTYLGSLP